jgi:hypothetical protein
MKFYSSSHSFSYLLPITFYQLPYTIYQLPVIPLDKCPTEKELNEKKSVKNNGLPAALIRCELDLQAYLKSVPGVWRNLDSGANPIAKMAKYKAIQRSDLIGLLMIDNALRDKTLCQTMAKLKYSKTILISKSPDGKV